MGAVVELLDYHKQQREERPFRVLASARFISSLADLRDFPRATCILVRRDAAGSARVLTMVRAPYASRSLNGAVIRCAGAMLGANEVHVWSKE